MTIRVGPKGQVVVPKAVRDRVGIAPGDDVVVDEIDGDVRIRRAKTIDDFIGVSGPPDGMREWQAVKREDREIERQDDSARLAAARRSR